MANWRYVQALKRLLCECYSRSDKEGAMLEKKRETKSTIPSEMTLGSFF